MRIIAGTAKSLPLKTLEGKDVRPTTDRIKETLFNMLQSEVPGAVFLDLFAGSGSIGLEALSRGAKEAFFVEKERAAAACIEENIRFTKFTDQSHLMKMDVSLALRTLEGNKVFDIVFMDPPYHKFLEKEVLTYLADSALVREESLIIVEASDMTSFDYIEALGFSIKKLKKYKTNVHLFLYRNL
ncbi:MAG: 16S rRNA (guanine(966)-N(2))-methyltransferase RsmD [Lachnospiraceae bacterium]|nr:16S rRNA (guanine(966)-N(2))-methyltransferase RsmD [Lachnospiraceae bacterium]